MSATLKQILEDELRISKEGMQDWAETKNSDEESNRAYHYFRGEVKAYENALGFMNNQK